jgi:hypothetical protein
MVKYISVVPDATWLEGMANAIHIPDEAQYCVCADTKMAAIIRNLPETEQQVAKIQTTEQRIIMYKGSILNERLICVSWPCYLVQNAPPGAGIWRFRDPPANMDTEHFIECI